MNSLIKAKTFEYTQNLELPNSSATRAPEDSAIKDKL
jgi:hypothetical protein